MQHKTTTKPICLVTDVSDVFCMFAFPPKGDFPFKSLP